MTPRLSENTIFKVALFNNEGKVSGRWNYYKVGSFSQGDDESGQGWKKSFYRVVQCTKNGNKMATKYEIPFIADSLEHALLDRKDSNYALVQR